MVLYEHWNIIQINDWVLLTNNKTPAEAFTPPADEK